MHGQRDRRPGPRHGLSAIEIIIVIAVFAILVTLAWPRYRMWHAAMLKAGLKESIEAGDREATLGFLERGAPPDAWSGATPHYCLRCEVVLKGDLEMANLVFPKEERGMRRIPPHNPPFLNLAVALKNPEMVDLLLESERDVNSRASYGFHKHTFSGSPGKALQQIHRLYLAYKQLGNPTQDASVGVELVPYVVPAYRMVETSESGEHVRTANLRQNMHMNTLLHDAVALDSAVILQRLLEHGVDPELRDGKGRTAHQLATGLDRDHLANILVAAGACADCPEGSEGETTTEDKGRQTFDD